MDTTCEPTTDSLTPAAPVSAQITGSETAPPSACNALPSTATSTPARRPGPGPDNLSALKTGRRAKPARLVDATFPKAAKHAAAKRDAWHRLATAALMAHTGRPLSFAQVDALRDAARHEAIALLSEHRRRQAGLTHDQLAGLDSTIATALASKSKILTKLGLAPSDKAAAIDPYADYLDSDEDEPADAPQVVPPASQEAAA